MASTCFKGKRSHEASLRPPIGVRVASRISNNELRRLRERKFSKISRLRTVASSNPKKSSRA